MEAIFVGSLMSLVSLVSFFARFRVARHRQQMVTWPRMSVYFDPNVGEINLERGSESAWRPQLNNSFHFYLRGELFSGNRLLLEEGMINAGERREISRRLNRNRDALTVTYNPAKPEENALLVPYEDLSWFSLVLHLAYGVAFPLSFQSDPDYAYLVIVAMFLVMLIGLGYDVMRNDRYLKDLIPLKNHTIK